MGQKDDALYNEEQDYSETRHFNQCIFYRPTFHYTTCQYKTNANLLRKQVTLFVICKCQQTFNGGLFER